MSFLFIDRWGSIIEYSVINHVVYSVLTNECELPGVCLSCCLLAVVTRFGYVWGILSLSFPLVDEPSWYVATDVVCIQTMYQLFCIKKVQVVLDL